MAGFADDQEVSDHLAAILKALAHSSRLRIVSALSEGEENVGALAERLHIAPAILSQQLRILRMSGLVDFRREEGYALYRLAQPRLKELLACLEKCPREPKKGR